MVRAHAHHDGTELVTELEITLDLPLPKASGRAVRAAMRKVIDTMGDRFSQRLLDAPRRGGAAGVATPTAVACPQPTGA